MGDQSQFLRYKAVGKIPASKAIELKFTNSAPKITSAAMVSVEFFTTKGGVLPAMSVVDGDGDALTYSLDGLSDALKSVVLIDAKTGVITVSGATPAALYSFKRVVSDGKLTASQNITLKMTAVIVPEAPSVLGNDATNVLVPAVGVDITKLEVSLDGGTTYVSFNIATTYLGNKTVLVRVIAIEPNPAGKTTEVKFTNSAPVITSGSSVSL